MRKNRREVGFDVDAYTARLIGRENVSKVEGAILELAKNAYDADATAVCFYYSEQERSLLIMDNGEGMTEEVIRRHWMTIGNSSKKSEYVSQRGRIKTGAKGIGRFALDRISEQCQMWTNTGQEALIWEVCWEDFSDHKRISEVKAQLYDTDQTLLSFVEADSWKNHKMAELFSLPKTGFHGTGTVFRLTSLRDDWTEQLQQKIRRHLANLLPPDAVESFKLYFFNDKTELALAEIESNSVDQFDYRISFQVTPEEETSSHLQIRILRNEFDVVGKLDLCAVGFSEQDAAYFAGKEIVIERPLREIVSQPGGENLIGFFSGTLYFNKISVAKQDQKKFYYRDFTGRKNFTKEFGGIKIYRDNFRVRPYGEYGDNDFDWLELSARRNRQPAALSHKIGRWRVGSEQMMGIVKISRENRNLEDDANRNGLQDGPGLLQLREILLAVIDEFERDRQYVGRILSDYYSENEKNRKALEDLAKLAEERRKWEAEQKKELDGLFVAKNHRYDETRAPVADPIQVQKLVSDLLKEKEQAIQDLNDEIMMLRTLATTGILTNMFMHEIRTLTHNIGMELDGAYEALELDDDKEYALRQIVRAVDSKRHFNSWFGITIGAIKKNKLKRRTYDIGETLAEFMDAWRAVLKKSGVELVFDCEPGLRLRCFVLDLENIFSNLFSNSVASFERESEIPLNEKRIFINITEQSNRLIRIDYQDTGWGLSDIYKKYPERILEAFETDKKLSAGWMRMEQAWECGSLIKSLYRIIMAQ